MDTKAVLQAMEAEVAEIQDALSAKGALIRQYRAQAEKCVVESDELRTRVKHLHEAIRHMQALDGERPAGLRQDGMYGRGDGA